MVVLREDVGEDEQRPNIAAPLPPAGVVSCQQSSAAFAPFHGNSPQRGPGRRGAIHLHSRAAATCLVPPRRGLLPPLPAVRLVGRPEPIVPSPAHRENSPIFPLPKPRR